MQNISVREHQRIEVDLPCEIQTARGAPFSGRLVDLSLGGCGIRSPILLQQGQDITLDLSLPDGRLEALKVQIRSVRQSFGAFFLGCSFGTEQPHHLAEVSFFFHTSIERLRSSDPPKGRILLAEEDLQQAEALALPLRAHGFQLCLVQSAVDLFHRLKLWHPQGIILGQPRSDLSGLQLSKVITMAEPEVALFLHGCNAKERREAHALGLKVSFPELDGAGIKAFIAIIKRELGDP